jgi:hypothetical protein
MCCHKTTVSLVYQAKEKRGGSNDNDSSDKSNNNNLQREQRTVALCSSCAGFTSRGAAGSSHFVRLRAVQGLQQLWGHPDGVARNEQEGQGEM